MTCVGDPITTVRRLQRSSLVATPGNAGIVVTSSPRPVVVGAPTSPDAARWLNGSSGPWIGYAISEGVHTCHDGLSHARLASPSMWVPHLPQPSWNRHAGTGTSLMAILERKLAAVSDAHVAGNLPAEIDRRCPVSCIEALASIYAVDISVDNIIGGTTGHEIGARTRLRPSSPAGTKTGSGRASRRGRLLRSAQWLLVTTCWLEHAVPQPRTVSQLVETICHHQARLGSGSPGHGSASEARRSGQSWLKPRPKPTGLMSLFGPPARHICGRGLPLPSPRLRTDTAPRWERCRNRKDRELMTMLLADAGRRTFSK